MAMAILIDGFDGDLEEFYGLVQEEIRKREIPGVEIEAASEFRSKGWFARGESAPQLKVQDDAHRVFILAYQFGRSFHVSTRAYWRTYKMGEKDRQGKLAFLEEVRSGAFSETIDRAVRTALTRHLEKRSVAIPPSLNPQDIFYKRETQTGEEQE